ncbi:MAG: Uma2 family endonuclease [Leptolyngbyaceae cyanobacterium MO_188.B28]|nr:Uma2 family endonuclease [Leptolyngbyaceae cyanobacterium MO_188.B28]
MVMVQSRQTKLTLQEFLASPQSNGSYELVDGETVPKVSPKRFHSKTQRALLRLLEDWGEERGEIGVEWAVTLQRRGKDWAPIPDLLFVSKERLPDDLGGEPCPVPPDLAVEIISPDQPFGEMLEKVLDYLTAGVLTVWIVDPRAQSITVFVPEAAPATYRGDLVLIHPALPGLELTAQQVFERAGLSN